ncbi:hypothetical protein COGO111638_09175 [Corynebacterium gottingense]
MHAAVAGSASPVSTIMPMFSVGIGSSPATLPNIAMPVWNADG